jgi:hypothetical protein
MVPLIIGTQRCAAHACVSHTTVSGQVTADAIYAASTNAQQQIVDAQVDVSGRRSQCMYGVCVCVWGGGGTDHVASPCVPSDARPTCCYGPTCCIRIRHVVANLLVPFTAAKCQPLVQTYR